MTNEKKRIRSETTKLRNPESLNSVKDSLNRFGRLLQQSSEQAGLTQGKLSRLAKIEVNDLIVTGQFQKEDFGSFEQSTISKIIHAQQKPSYDQVFILITVIKSHYTSEELRQLCEEKEIQVPVFSPELEDALWELALYSRPNTVKRALEKEFLFEDSLIEHKEERWRRR